MAGQVWKVTLTDAATQAVTTFSYTVQDHDTIASIAQGLSQGIGGLNGYTSTVAADRDDAIVVTHTGSFTFGLAIGGASATLQPIAVDATVIGLTMNPAGGVTQTWSLDFNGQHFSYAAEFGDDLAAVSKGLLADITSTIITPGFDVTRVGRVLTIVHKLDASGNAVPFALTANVTPNTLGAPR